MNNKHEQNWAWIIQKNIYSLIILYLVLGVISASYIYWQKSLLVEIQKYANEYHLASNYHFIKAIEEIRKIEIHVAYSHNKTNHKRELHIKQIKGNDNHKHASSFYLIQREIQSALKLHRHFSNDKFNYLTSRLQRRLSNLDNTAKGYFLRGGFSNEALDAIKSLITPLKQLEKLHLIERDSLLTELSAKENIQSIALITLMLIIFLVGFLFTKRILAAIRIVSQQQIKFNEQIRLFSQVINQSPVSVMITDTDANIIFVNQHFEKTTGYSSEEMIGKNPNVLQSGKTPHKTYRNIWQSLINGQSYDGELYNRKKNGDLFCESAHFSPVFNEHGSINNFLVIKEDITHRKQQEEKILQQAHYDSLTKLPNRFLALDRLSLLLKEAQRKDQKVAVLFLDLDDFKKINDTLGHEAGDQLLIESAKRFLEVVRSSDTVGRLGGDEFIVLIDNLTDSSEALSIMKNLVNLFKVPFNLGGRELMITTSLGAAIFPEDGDNSSDLLRNADAAMYHAKEMGRNTYSFFTKSMNKKISRRLILEEQMLGALERDEFYVHYQPQLEVSSGRIIGAEALIRWNNPALDQVFPDEFIPIAEKTGMILALGEFVLNNALELTSQLQQDFDQNFKIAVNLSPIQFRAPDLVESIKKTLNQYDISTSSLELEVTEGILMSGHSYIDDAINALSCLGVKLAMDDFGTGYSSLSYLRNYPFNILKIDRSFINDITVDPADKELVNAIIAMAHSLGLKVIAEGVETEAQLAHLETKGCEYAQGYMFSKPVSSKKITEMIKEQSKAS